MPIGWRKLYAFKKKFILLRQKHTELNDNLPKDKWRSRLHQIIYEADTPEGKLFDLILIVAILFSIILVMLESVKSLDARYHDFFNISEWVITILFSLEYILRIISVKKP